MRHTSPLLAVILLALATPAAANVSADEIIPNLTGDWSRIGQLVETYEAIPGYSGAGPMLVDPKHPHVDGEGPPQWVAALNNPILKPDTYNRLKAITDLEISGVGHLKDEGMCQPSGVPMLLNRRGAAVQILQMKDRVVILNARDQQIRTIYLDVPHSDHLQPSWYGESIGHYENGDTLVVDTIGQNDKTQIDRFGTSHSAQLHVVERYRVSPDGKGLEVQFTVEDPIAFTVPWSARVRFRPSQQAWDEEVCAENNIFIGEVSIAGQVTKTVPIPTALHPDF